MFAPHIVKRGLTGLTVVLLIAASSNALAAPRERERQSRWVPTSFFAQWGSGDTDTYAYTVGATWDWNWQRQTSIGRLVGYTEVAVGRWEHDIRGDSDRQWFTQIGATPVLRLFPSAGDGRWFTEIGIGANYIAPLYITDRKTFSTQFNFGDHAASSTTSSARRSRCGISTSRTPASIARTPARTSRSCATRTASNAGTVPKGDCPLFRQTAPTKCKAPSPHPSPTSASVRVHPPSRRPVS